MFLSKCDPPRNNVLVRVGDPLFAIGIGTAAAWVRIRREEVERFHEAQQSGETSMPQAPPTQLETFDILRKRLSNVNYNPLEWNWRDAVSTKDRKRWGIVDEPGGKL